MNVNFSKVWVYRFCYAHHSLVWRAWSLFLVSAFVGFEALRRFRPVVLHASWQASLFYFSAGLVGVLLLASAPLLLFSGLYGVWFRYVALWTVRAAGAITRWLFTGLAQLLSLILRGCIRDVGVLPIVG